VTSWLRGGPTRIGADSIAMRKHWKAYCVYCGGRAGTRDHCPPKLLLERPYPPNLPTVRACASCNEGFSRDEEYFLAILAQVGSTPALIAKVAEGGSVDRALAKAPGLDERIIRSLSIGEDGTVFVQPEIDRIHRVIHKIALGIYVLRYGRIPLSESLAFLGVFPYDDENRPPMALVAATFTERFRPKRWSHVQRGIFSYIIVQDPTNWSRLCCVLDFHRSLWGVVTFPRPQPGAESGTEADCFADGVVMRSVGDAIPAIRKRPWQGSKPEAPAATADGRWLAAG